MRFLFLLLLSFAALQPLSASAHSKNFTIEPLDEVLSCDLKEDYINEMAANLNIINHDNQYPGHTSRKHINVSKEELLSSLQNGTKSLAYTSYRDQETVEHLIRNALRIDAKRILNWANSGDTKSTLKLQYKASEVLGHGVIRQEKDLQNSQEAVVVLKKQQKQCGFFILTSYPILAPK